MIPVVGVALDHRPYQVGEFTYRFRPGTVPIVTSHRDGRLLGYLDVLESIQGRAIGFRGSVDVDDMTAVRLRDGIPISIEAVRCVPPGTPSIPRDAETAARVATKTYWRGQLGIGWNLIGVSLTDNPAAPGSALWAAPAAATVLWSRDTGTRWTDLDWVERNRVRDPEAIDGWFDEGEPDRERHYT